MRYFLTSFIIVFAIYSIADTEKKARFELSIPDAFTTEEYKEDLQNWKKSLLKGLGYEESKITEAVFLKTDIPLKVNGELVLGNVYQNIAMPQQFYITASSTIVDFSLNKIGTMGVAGISQHPTPSKRMVVILAPQPKTSLFGVTLDFTGKVQVSPPVFNSNSVSYEWYAW